jgi:hypothetical protein
MVDKILTVLPENVTDTNVPVNTEQIRANPNPGQAELLSVSKNFFSIHHYNGKVHITNL